MKTNLLNLKNNLKELAEKIKESKIKTKEYQRANRGCDDGLFYDCWKLSNEFRHKHFAYCLLRGTPSEKIEQHTREGNEINMKKVEEVMDEYKFEDVRACA